MDYPDPEKLTKTKIIQKIILDFSITRKAIWQIQKRPRAEIMAKLSTLRWTKLITISKFQTNTDISRNWLFSTQKELNGRERDDLALNLVNRALRIFNIWHVIEWDPTRIPENRDGVVVDTHQSQGGEHGGVSDSGRGREAEPPINESENWGKVDETDHQHHHRDGERKSDSFPFHFFLEHRRRDDGVSDEWILI